MRRALGLVGWARRAVCPWTPLGCRAVWVQADAEPAALRRGAAELQRSPDISVHKGFKLQAALCVERPPLFVQEPDFKKRWRAFREAWEKRTQNSIQVDDDLVFMRYHFQFLEDPRAMRALSAVPAADSGANAPVRAAGEGGVDALDQLLATEGLDLTFPKQGRKIVRRKKVDQRVEERVDDSDLHSMKRLAHRTLFLLVRYGQGSKWTFPKADRVQGQPIRETLERLCERQLGSEFSPYLLGACPFSHRKRRSERDPGIDGRKVFYYRARAWPGVGSDLSLGEESPVVDWAWCSRDELSKFLQVNEWHCVREGLPMDSAIL